MTLYKWSQTATNNQTADSTINWVEGQAPSSVNDSARAMMAATAKWCSDISGRTAAGGTQPNYTFTSSQGFDTLAHLDGAMIGLKVTVTNASSPVTLNVDGLGAKPWRISPGVEIGANALVVGVSYVVTYNNSDGAFYLQDGALAAVAGLSPILVPIGGVIMWMTTALPNSSWYWCNGTQVTSAYLATPANGYPSALIVNSTTIITPNMAELMPYGVAGMGGIGGRGFTSTLVPNQVNWNKLGAGGNSYIGESAHVLLASESRSHTHTGALNNGGVSGGAADHTHGYNGFAGTGTAYPGGGVFSGSAANQPQTTGSNYGGGYSIPISANVIDAGFTTAAPRSDEAGNPFFGDGAHNTQGPAYPIGFIIRIA